MIFLLGQKFDSIKKILIFFDSNLANPLPERTYVVDCDLFSENGMKNMWNSIDHFFPTHLLGWFFLMLMLREFEMCFIASILFEMLEFTLKNHL